MVAPSMLAKLVLAKNALVTNLVIERLKTRQQWRVFCCVLTQRSIME